ncbi:MAG: hypothetical protein LBG92_08945 [Prevotellaceae bacterium]|jgi:hypothetical protein|nr:hypothetical protein [Prevotellaceae bacterium]
MIDKKYIIDAFSYLGEVMASYCRNGKNSEIENAVQLSISANYWFTEENIRVALQSIADKMLDSRKLNDWLEKYSINLSDVKKIGLITAGNIPAVGFHDLLCIVVSGNIATVKPSSKDKFLLKTLCDIVTAKFPLLKEYIVFEDINLENIDALIATGSNNSARYFYAEYGKIHLLIRKNRYSMAVLDGFETKEELAALGEDIFLYFGLGCRNVSNICIPAGYDFNLLLNVINGYSNVMEHQGYIDCFRYQKAVSTVLEETFIAGNSLILRKRPLSYSSIAVVNCMEYNSIEDVKQFIADNAEKIQCVAGHVNIDGIIAFGQTQKPGLDDYADGIDTVQFLNNII